MIEYRFYCLSTEYHHAGCVPSREKGEPVRGKQLEWLLLTTVPVNSFEDAGERLDWHGISASLRT
ncbi:MAG: hypothetical protein GWP06_13450 [Actinobacteria bacterium]|nr:hypothetical protein [Actinomycetota bacterium]